MKQEESDRLRIIFRSFKRSASRLRNGYELINESTPLKFNIRWEEGKSIEASFDERDSLVRYSALLRPFMASHSPLELSSVWQIISENRQLVDDAKRSLIAGLFSRAETLDIPILLNNKLLTAHDIYFAYAEGALFGEYLEAKRLLVQLSYEPLKSMVLFLFYSVCLNYSNIVFALLDILLDIERKTPELMIQHKKDPQCIYCLSRDGDFGSEEHVIPEAFGFDEMVLRDSVCYKCNNELSKLDQFLANFGPIAFLRVFYVPLTKKGKFPRAEFANYKIKKTRPRKVLLTGKMEVGGLDKINTTKPTEEFSFDLSFSHKMDVLRLARSIFKIGLGLVAYDYGSEYACGMRFNASRKFICGEGLIPNHMLLSTVGKPHPSISTWCQSTDISTNVALDIYGPIFVINLDPSPWNIPPEMPSDLFMQFWLGSENNGEAISPCPKGCKHP